MPWRVQRARSAIARFTETRPRASVELAGERVIVQAPWHGEGPVRAWTRRDQLPPLLAPLAHLRDVERIASTASHLTLEGDLGLAHRLSATFHVVDHVTSLAQRARERLRARGLDRGWRVTLCAEGRRVTVRRALQGRRPPEQMLAHVHATSVCSDIDAIELTWAHVPTPAELVALDAALRASSTYR